MKIRKSIIVSAMLLTTVALTAQVADSAQRKVVLQGALNFRDLGGYATKDGKHIKWGKIYRSAEISNLSTADLSKLDQLAINHVLDFRGPAEVATAPDKVPAHASRLSLPYGSETTGDRGAMMKIMSTATNGDSIIMPFYTNITAFGKRYKPVFESLLNNPADSAVLFHCTAGKDRTGIAAALVLYSLGVDEATIMNDYLASNYYRVADNENRKKMMIAMYNMKEAVVTDVLTVKEKYLNATFDTIRAQYGSIDNYLEKEMGMDKKATRQLKQKYLL